jgi:hypothetical protein
VQRLLENGADVNAKGGFFGTALQAAPAEGNDQVLQRPPENRSDANSEGLQAASYKGHDRALAEIGLLILII